MGREFQIAAPEYMNDLRKSSQLGFGVYSWLQLVDLVSRHELLLSSHNLHIETGRWHRPHSIPREDRTCNICNKLEDVTNWKMNTISLSNVHYILIY